MNHIRLLLPLIFCLICASAQAAPTKEYTPYSVPNVHLQDRNCFVSDPDSLLSPQARDQADATLRALMDSTGAEVAVVLLPSLQGQDIYDFSHKLARHWGIGKKDKNSGLLILFDMEGHQVRIHTGKGIEGILPDAACLRLIDETVVPHMRTGDLDDAVGDLTQRVSEIIRDPQAAAEIASDQTNDELSEKELMGLMALLALLVGIGGYAFLFISLYRLRGADDFRRTRSLAGKLPGAWILGVLSGGLAIPAALVMWLLERHYRRRPKKCEQCGSTMHRLPEDEDNAHLTPAQDTEENIGSVDYDVWLCPTCGAKEIFPFLQTSPYTPCPKCGARAYSRLYKKVLSHPTTVSEGLGVNVYTCKNCGHREEKYYDLPPTPPVIIAGGSRSDGGGGFGGGSSGGSWGGGSFGGGGATGSW